MMHVISRLYVERIKGPIVCNSSLLSRHYCRILVNVRTMKIHAQSCSYNLDVSCYFC